MKTETIETKKCNNCLKRVAIYQHRCSCGKVDFTYDGAVITRTKPQKSILFENITALIKKL
jgi:hypothetical protein